MKVLLMVVLMVLAASRPGYSQAIDDITFYTENFPPFNFKEDGRLRGISADVLAEILKDTGAKKTVQDVILTDWSAGYAAALKGPNVGLFSTTRRPDREGLFKWVGPIHINSADVIRKKGSTEVLDDPSKIKGFRLAVITNSLGHNTVRNLGVPENNVFTFATPDDLIQALEADKVDLWIFSETVGMWLLRQKGLADKYEAALTLVRAPLFFAFSKDVSDDFIEDVQETLDNIKLDDRFDKIRERYN